MASTTPGDDLERFWQPPPASLSRLPTLRTTVASWSSPRLWISRVAQLDADLLDGEVESILHAPVSAAIDGVKVRHACDVQAGSHTLTRVGIVPSSLQTAGGRSWQPEFMAMLKLSILKLSLWESNATYGASLQNLRYRDEGKVATGERILRDLGARG